MIQGMKEGEDDKSAVLNCCQESNVRGRSNSKQKRGQAFDDHMGGGRYGEERILCRLNMGEANPAKRVEGCPGANAMAMRPKTGGGRQGNGYFVGI